jgi:hypothetical protein
MPSCKRSDMQRTAKEVYVVHQDSILRDVCLTSVIVTAGYVSSLRTQFRIWRFRSSNRNFHCNPHWGNNQQCAWGRDPRPNNGVYCGLLTFTASVIPFLGITAFGSLEAFNILRHSIRHFDAVNKLVDSILLYTRSVLGLCFSATDRASL